MAAAPILLRPALLHGLPWGSPLLPSPSRVALADPELSFSDVRLLPAYPARSPLEDVLRLVDPAADQYVTEVYASEIATVLKRWSHAFKNLDLAAVADSLDASLAACSLMPVKQSTLRTGFGVESVRREFSPATQSGKARFVEDLRAWLGSDLKLEVADFEITSIEETQTAPVSVSLEVRYEFVAARGLRGREQWTGSWRMDWSRDTGTEAARWKVRRWRAGEETLSVARESIFVDVTHQALSGAPSYAAQMMHGSDYWRTVLDGASGIDVYGNNGVAAGDFDNDGLDDLYISQPAGLPNRLYRNRGDGTFDDVTEKAGVGVLDNTACALFADFRNVGLQDLLVVCGSGPLLFLNHGDGSFRLKPYAFRFAQPPQGSFTHAALADYDRDGRLDVYFCLYSYYLGLDQYHYPVPYFDARNGPPNFLFHNEGDGTFVDRTAAAGLHAENDRYSFACAWGESLANNLPDLYVANDFGRNNFYRNQGDGTFKAVARAAHVEDVGAGMSACWTDVNQDGHPDLYAANMWSAAGQRVAQQARFHANAPEEIRAFYRQHARGNALYRNLGDGTFRNATQEAGVEMGRWAWGSDLWDFDQDGYPDIYVTNGYISARGRDQAGESSATSPMGGAPQRNDLGSFFWRQIVANSPNDTTPSLAYEHGWNALNELIRSDFSWSGYERNVVFANNGDGTFSNVSGAVGLDFMEDGRSFALADLDRDGRLEIVLKNRNGPQLRILRNAAGELGESIVFRLRGTTSNRDAIGAAITLERGALGQTKYLQAGSGFLAQHSKEVFFGIGKPPAKQPPMRATVRWPSGLIQHFEELSPNTRVSIEEGKPTFAAQPFAATAAAYTQPGLPGTPETLPTSLETWLIDPLRAPEFSLPDLGGKPHTLAALQGDNVLLHFWATTSPVCREQLRLLNQRGSTYTKSGLSVIAVNVDDALRVGQVRRLAEEEALSFPVLLADAQQAGIYNIIYRYLFDRRRDLALPTSFLIDAGGMIVKVYQGRLDPEHLLADVQRIPGTQAERTRQALPFAGTLYQGTFARNDFTYGVAMFQHGYLDQAGASFAQVIAAKPEDAEAHYNLGTLKLRQNDYAAARRHLEQALKLRPNYPEAWNNLGMMAAQQGQAEEATQSFQQSLVLRPGYAVALLNLGNVYRRRGDAPKAQDCLQRALALEPDDPETNYSLGMFYAQQGQLQPASEYLEKAVALRPDYPEALNNLGVLLVRRQEYAQAEEQFTTCIRIHPSFDQSYLNLARLYVLQRHKEKARDALESLLRLQPQSAAAKQGLDMLASMP